MSDELSRRTGEISAEKLALLVLRAKKKRAEMPGVGRIPRRTASGPAPLSFAQQRLWVLDRLEPGSTAYNMPSVARLRGALDAAAFERALGEIVRRHDTLRTTFAESDGEPVQIVAPFTGFRLPFTDLTGLPDEQRRAEERRLVLAERRPYDLEHGPLFRARLARTGEEEHLLLLDVHHIVSDGWSYGVFFRELGALYEAFLAGRPSPLPELPIQFADFAAWQREWLQGPVQQEQLAYWRQRLAGVPPALELPLDRLRPAVQTHRGELARLDLPAGLAAGLRELARREGASPFMTLLAVFQLLLARLSGQDDVVVGSPSAGRSRLEMEGLIGLFLNTLVLRTDLSGDPTFRELLGRVREVVLGAYQYQDIPFERLLEELQPERQLSRTPIFQVLFNFVSLSDLRLELAGLRVEPVALEQADSKFDFTLYVRELPDTLRLDLVYNADLFEPARMEEMLRQLEHLVAQAVAAPESPIGALSLVTPAAAALLPDPARTLDDSWHGAAHHALSRQAARNPERPAVSDEKGTAWTYGELEARANRLAHFLIAHGVEKGDAVAVWAQRGAPLVQALMGTLKAGAAFLILDPAYPAPRLLDYLRIGRPTAWIGVPGAPPPPSELEEAVASLCRAGLDELSGYPETDPGVSVGPDDAACITFTSGSTGTPKGVVGRHGPLTHFHPWMGERFELGGDDRFGMLSALSHDPLQRDVINPIWFGAPLAVPDPDEMATPGYLAAWARRERVTVLNLTPAMMEVLVDSAEGDLPDLRRAFVVGDQLKKTDVERLYRLAPDAVCVNLYGSTETQRSLSYFVVPRELDRLGKEVLPLGRGMEGCQLLVRNAAAGLAGVGELGEICFRGPHLARGYLGDEALTAERFVGDTYRTGDLGRYLPDGGVEIAGRADFQVKLRGFRIELGEVEAALERFPGVRECAVIVRERSLVAYLVPVYAAPSASELRAFLGARLPDYMVPSAFVVLPALPLTRTGKVDRGALPAPEEIGAGRGTVAPPRNPVEEALSQVWREVLRREQVGIHDNFFELGGDSIRTIQVVARSRKHGIKIAARQIFQHQTIAELANVAELAEVERQAEELPLAPAQRRVPAGAARETVRVAVPPAVNVERGLAELRARHEALRGEDALRSELLPGGELLLSAHPLAVDGPSWNVLLSDLAALCQGQEPPPAGSFAAWAVALAGEPVPPAASLPSTAGPVTVHLAPAETAALLGEARRAYGNSVEEILVAALAPSRAVVEVEGLRPEREGLDGSRVVGCLAVPVRVLAEPRPSPGDTLKEIKERLRQAPSTGEATPPDTALRWTAPFDLPAPWRAERAPGPFLAGAPLRVDCRLEDGRLRADLTSAGSHRHEDLVRMAGQFVDRLRALVQHCQSPEAGGFTPSDFPVAGLDQMDLDELLAELG